MFGAMMKLIQKLCKVQGMNECESHSACFDKRRAASGNAVVRQSSQSRCPANSGNSSRFGHRASPTPVPVTVTVRVIARLRLAGVDRSSTV
jgi:hypothetical protein